MFQVKVYDKQAVLYIFWNHFTGLQKNNTSCKIALQESSGPMKGKTDRLPFLLECCPWSLNLS